MRDDDYALVYGQGTSQHEQVILDHAGFTPDEEQFFRLIRSRHNPDARFIEDTMKIDARTRRRIEHGMRLKVAYLILESIKEYGQHH